MPAPAIDSLVREVADVFGRRSDPKLAADALSECVRRVTAQGFFLDERHLGGSADGFSRHELHRDPSGRFLIVSCVWAPQQSTPIHDHAAPGIIAGLQGRVIMTTYRRLDDGLTPGYASITEVSRLLISESSSGAVRPPEEAIHRIENPFREVAMTLHVFVAGGEEPSVFDPRAKTLIPAGAEAQLAGV